MRYAITIIAIPLFLFSCDTSINKSGTSNGDSAPFKVEYFGALKNMMHKGDISAQANLSDFENTQNLYALGALENLYAHSCKDYG
jgi:hypothetical protein